ncbi:MAG: hypothetical protein O7B30_00240 [Thaumarchaeota archaeon]|nr:hypothetical protein [Nitrososphaerota archaeon]
MKSLARVCGVDDAVGEFFLGHKMDKWGYDKSPWKYSGYFRDEYSKMSSYLNVLTQIPTPKAANAKLEDLKKEVANLKIRVVEKEKELHDRTKQFDDIVKSHSDLAKKFEGVHEEYHDDHVKLMRFENAIPRILYKIEALEKSKKN